MSIFWFMLGVIIGGSLGFIMGMRAGE